MIIEMLNSKIHRATVNMSNINYEGSISISEELMQAAKIIINQKVLVVDVNNGNRFETYVIKSDYINYICINGAAARLVNIGDKVIIMSFVFMNLDEASNHEPKIVLLDNENKIKS